jgi:hypothetical protein
MPPLAKPHLAILANKDRYFHRGQVEHFVSIHSINADAVEGLRCMHACNGFINPHLLPQQLTHDDGAACAALDYWPATDHLQHLPA